MRDNRRVAVRIVPLICVQASESKFILAKRRSTTGIKGDTRLSPVHIMRRGVQGDLPLLNSYKKLSSLARLGQEGPAQRTLINIPDKAPITLKTRSFLQPHEIGAVEFLPGAADDFPHLVKLKAV